ncbi:MAG: nitrogenase component 1 [Chitinispirillaceae bacterium]
MNGKTRIRTSSAAVNTCTLCAPLGASIAFKGVQEAISLLHGSQGCATYIRRYLISHYREPIDIASSSISEEATIFGGDENLIRALENITSVYHPRVIGVATTCLTETIGEDTESSVRRFLSRQGDEKPFVVNVSTPSYCANYSDGFNSTVKALVATFASSGEHTNSINLLPGPLSPADYRHLKELIQIFGFQFTLLPDYSETLDGESWTEYHHIAKGGTTVLSIKDMGRACATLEFTVCRDKTETASEFLKGSCHVPAIRLMTPIGLDATDEFMAVLQKLGGKNVPETITKERGRLVDSYINAHKYCFGKKAALIGEEELVVSIAKFLSETGIVPVLCASSCKKGKLRNSINTHIPEIASSVTVIEETDYDEFGSLIRDCGTDIVIGSSKAYKSAKNADIPLVRVGFPIHDRFGGQRLLHVGYRGTQRLFDEIINTLLSTSQESSDLQYGYL